MARVLETLGELARVAGLALQAHVSEILPLVIEALNDASNSKKAVAITTLGQVACLYADQALEVWSATRMLSTTCSSKRRTSSPDACPSQDGHAVALLISKADLMPSGEQVVESTGCVMVPYQQYPNLMGTLLLMLADRNNETLRYPVIIVSHLCRH